MIRKINFRTAGKGPEQTSEKKVSRRNTSRLYTSTVEYAIIANLVTQQYQRDEQVRFDTLLAIPVEDRIPGLIDRYGQKTMHRLLTMILREFVATSPLPRYKKPSETKISVLACEIMLSAEEDFLSLEDVILFLQRVKAGYFGSIKSLENTTVLSQLLERYRQARHQAWMKLKDQQQVALKQLGPVMRVAAEPTPINDLFHQAVVVDINKKMSG